MNPIGILITPLPQVLPPSTGLPQGHATSKPRMMIGPHDGGHWGPAASHNTLRSTAAQNPASSLHSTKATQIPVNPLLLLSEKRAAAPHQAARAGLVAQEAVSPRRPPTRPSTSGAAGLCPRSLRGPPGHPPTPGPARGLFQGGLTLWPQAPDTPGWSNGLPTRSGSIGQGAARVSMHRASGRSPSKSPPG